MVRKKESISSMKMIKLPKNTDFKHPNEHLVTYFVSPSETATMRASSRWGQLTNTGFPST